MQLLVGQSVSPGYAEGTAVLFDRVTEIEIPRHEIDHSQVSREWNRFREALERSCRDLRQLERRVLAELGDAQSSIFSAHLSLLRDQQFVDRIKQRIRNQLVNVEQAIDSEVADLARLLGTLESEYLRQRAQDIRDVGLRLMRQVGRGLGNSVVDLPSDAVLIACELLPSETIDLDRKQVAAIITEEGGENSHAAILRACARHSCRDWYRQCYQTNPARNSATGRWASWPCHADTEPNGNGELCGITKPLRRR